MLEQIIENKKSLWKSMVVPNLVDFETIIYIFEENFSLESKIFEAEKDSFNHLSKDTQEHIAITYCWMLSTISLNCNKKSCCMKVRINSLVIMHHQMGFDFNFVPLCGDDI
jgi:hypothetical protein